MKFITKDGIEFEGEFTEIGKTKNYVVDYPFQRFGLTTYPCRIYGMYKWVWKNDSWINGSWVRDEEFCKKYDL